MVALKIGIITFILALNFNVKAQSLKAGDILLASLPCWICSVIELEEDSLFSHIGILNQENGEWVVYESFGEVRKSKLPKFLKGLRKDRIVRVLRLRSEPNFSARKLQSVFEKKYEGLSYDNKFLWNNYDHLGREKYYCSEFVQKFFLDFISLTLTTKRMHFDKKRKYWERFFKGEIPDGELGISPEDFNKSADFIHLKDFYPHAKF